MGLSGGIGSGKSAVARAWADLGAHVADADALAREVVEPGSPGLADVIAHFGPQILDGETLDRARLADLVFADPHHKATLEGILHPLINAAAEVVAEGTPPGEVFVYDVPLLVEGEMGNQFDCVVIVSASEATRLTRLEGRGLPPAQARARMATQASAEQRRRVANVWIENEGALAETTRLASRVFQEWLRPIRGRGAEGEA